MMMDDGLKLGINIDIYPPDGHVNLVIINGTNFYTIHVTLEWFEHDD